MRICYISSYPPTVCGIGDYTESLVKELINLYGDIYIDVIAEHEAKSSSKRIKVYPVFDRKNYNGREIINTLQILKPDIIHIQHSFGIFGADDRLLNIIKFSKKLNSRIVVTFHTVHTRETVDFEVKGYDIEEYNRIISSYADHIIVHTNSMKHVLMRQGIPEDKISVIRLGAFKFTSDIDLEQARSLLNLPLNIKLIVVPGFIHRTKGTKLAIRLCKELLKHTENFRLAIAGWVHPKEFQRKNIQYAYECLKLIEKYNLKKHVLVTRRNLSREELSYYIYSADLILLLYTQFNWSTSGILKVAIGAGKPFIVTRIPKFEEVSEEISDELTVLPNDFKRMVKLTYRLLFDEQFRDHIISRVKDYAKKVSWSNSARKHIELYNKLL